MDQVLSPPEIPVLRSLCTDPDGMLWAGDTAQTISRGSSFSFSELKAFMYRLEVRIFPFYTAIYTNKTFLCSDRTPKPTRPI